MTIGIYGGTFDPPHIGHIQACKNFLNSFKVDKMYVIPTSIPPHKVRNSIVDGTTRFEMCKKAFENIAVYFVWRHFLKSVYEDEFYSKIAFSVLSTLLIAVLYAAENQVFSTDELIVKSVYYSKEVEYSEQNLCKIFDNFYENDAFSISKISSLLKFFGNF
jgi:cytidyltransferase-like protein